jgi:formylglycine-generating enzyme required for sulfatase activity
MAFSLLFLGCPDSDDQINHPKDLDIPGMDTTVVVDLAAPDLAPDIVVDQTPTPDQFGECKHPKVTKNCTPDQDGSAWCTIPPGCFEMGPQKSDKCKFNNEILHKVRLTTKFEMMSHEVTQGLFKTMMGYNPSYFTGCGKSCPVEQVTWHEAASYCNAEESPHFSPIPSFSRRA